MNEALQLSRGVAVRQCPFAIGTELVQIRDRERAAARALREARFERRAEGLAHGLQLDAIEDLGEEAAHDQALRLAAREPAGHEVEELVAIDLADCRTVRTPHV